MSINSTISATVDLEEEVRSLKITDQWSLLQILWDRLKCTGIYEDWKSFYEDNGLKERTE